jgi:Ca2+-binding RTX toxin-like protein
MAFIDINGTDVAGDQSTTVSVGVGGSVQGNVATTSDSDWYKIDLVAGQSYFFSLDSAEASGLADAYLKLYGPFNSLVAGNNDAGAGNNAFISFTATMSGSYYLAASGYAGATGSYVLKAAAAPADTIAGGRTTTATMTVGQTLTGLANTSTDSDWYAIQLTAGVSYIFTLSGTDGADYGGMDFGGLNILTGPGAYMASGSYAPEYATTVYSPVANLTTVTFTPTTTDTYYIMATAAGGQYNPVDRYAGGYTLTANVLPADIDAQGAVTLTAGQSVSSRFETTTDVDTFSVSLVAGQTYSFYILPTGNDPVSSSELLIYPPSGTRLSSSGDLYNDNLAEITFQATQTGVYQVAAKGWGGSYTLHSAQLANLPANTTTPQAIAVGGDDYYGYLSSSTDHDWVAVDLVAGQSYIFNMDAVSRFIDPQLSLVNAAGVVLATNNDVRDYVKDAQIVYTATQTGRYYLDAGAFSNSGGTYLLSAARTSDGAGQTTQTAAGMSIGQMVTAALDHVGDQDWYAVTLAEGATYSFDLYTTGPDAINYPRLIMKSADGTIVGGGSVSAAEIHTRFTATAGGTYYISVESNADASTGGYRLLSAMIDDIASNNTTRGVIGVGQTINGTIDFASDYNISNVADSDWYGIDLVAGQSYIFKLDKAASGLALDPFLTLYDSEGNYLSSNDNGAPTYYYEAGGNAFLQFIASATDTYYLAARGAGSQMTGGYTLSAQTTNDIFDSTQTHTALTIGGSLESTLDTATDRDWVRLNLAEGQSYVFSADPQAGSGLTDLRLELYDGSGNIIRTVILGPTEDGAAMRYTASHFGTYPGTFYLAVSSHSGDTGGYNLRTMAAAPQNPLDTIDGDTQVAGTQVKVYFAGANESFSGEAGNVPWRGSDIDGFLAAAGTWSNYANIGFTRVLNAQDADLVVMLDSSPGEATRIEGVGSAPDVVVMNSASLAYGVQAGTSAYWAFLQASGLALGLKQTYVWTPTGEAMEGVPGAGAYSGTAGLNNPAYTVMSYYQQLAGTSSAAPVTPMALDIALLQQKYGSVAHNATDTTYTIEALLSGSATYVGIWDTGGIDTISYSGVGPITIDLRPASLTNTAGGGGYISGPYNGYSALVGYTIANGTVIENATGGVSGDTLTGNDANNILTGNAGDDTLQGGKGDDTLSGGDGADTVSYSDSAVGVTVDLSLTTAQNTGNGTDTLSSIERFVGSSHNDVLRVNNADNRANGGAGNDTLVLTGNYADYAITEQYSAYGRAFAFVSSTGGTDYIDAFEVFQFADRTLTAAQLINTKPQLQGDFGAIMLENTGYVLTTEDIRFVDEDSAYLTYTVTSLTHGAVYVNGVASSNFTSDQLAAGLVSFRHDGHTDPTAYFSFTAFDGITYADSYPGSMNFVVIHAPGVVFNGTAGDDYIVTSGAKDFINGGAGNDIIDGRDGADTIYGGAGNDLIYLYFDNVGFDGGDGIDTITYERMTRGVYTYSLGPNNENVIGTRFDDTLVGSFADNVIDGGQGADNMTGGYGSDTYIVDNGGDVIVENDENGDDTVNAYVSYRLSENIEILNLIGSQALVGIGNRSHNIITGNAADNELNGLSGNDQLYGGDGRDKLYGGQGNDLLIGGHGDDTLYGETGRDTLFGEAGNDTLMGGAGDDILLGQDGNDTLFGESGHDTLVGGTGDDLLYGQEGFDTLTGDDGTDRLFGGADDDRLIGGFGDDQLYGEDGHDTLFGEFGNDTLIGGLGDDILLGQDGADVLFGELGNDTLVGGSGNDLQYGQAGFDTLSGEDGDDGLYGGADDDRLIGGHGRDSLYGEDGHDALFGEFGDDTLSGGAGNDALYGQAGVDTLLGGDGNDFLSGGAEGDWLTGGAGADMFQFDSPLMPADFITDFNRAEGDRFVINGSSFSAPAGFQLTQGVGFLSGAGVMPVAATASFYFDTQTRALWFDSDGTGAGNAHVIAFLLNTPTLAASDFLIV